MDIVFSSAVVGRTGDNDFSQRGTLIPHPSGDGRFTLTWFGKPNGQVLSVQPDGQFDVRPQGTSGAYETFCFDGSSLALVPNWQWDKGIPYFPAASVQGYVILAKRVH